MSVLLEGELASGRAAEERDGERDRPRARPRTVELGRAPETLGRRRPHGGRAVGGGGRRQRRTGGRRRPTADVLARPEQLREVVLALAPEPRELAGGVGRARPLAAQLTHHVAYHVHVLHLHSPVDSNTDSVEKGGN